MLFAILYTILRRVLRLGGISSDAEAEVLVLRHELAVLRRQGQETLSRLGNSRLTDSRKLAFSYKMAFETLRS